MATAFVASAAFAQNNSTMEASTSGLSSQGFRIGLVKPLLDVEAKVSYQGKSASAQETLDEALGLSLGYASLPVQELGWVTNFTYMDIKNDGSSTGVARIDGNLAYAISPVLNVKGGLNLSKLVRGEDHDKVNAGIGYQGGVGVQFTKNFGLDVGYTQMSQSGSSNGVSIDLKETGFEIGLNGTF